MTNVSHVTYRVVSRAWYGKNYLESFRRPDLHDEVSIEVIDTDGNHIGSEIVFRWHKSDQVYGRPTPHFVVFHDAFKTMVAIPALMDAITGSLQHAFSVEELERVLKAHGALDVTETVPERGHRIEYSLKLLGHADDVAKVLEELRKTNVGITDENHRRL